MNLDKTTNLVLNSDLIKRLAQLGVKEVHLIKEAYDEFCISSMLAYCGTNLSEAAILARTPISETAREFHEDHYHPYYRSRIHGVKVRMENEELLTPLEADIIVQAIERIKNKLPIKTLENNDEFNIKTEN